ncbi:hypothetical protein [Massilia sp. 9I]|uniref:hypothetical protein n=1 Tax=Massilia sp. 9I TaxID=2653152 RepID=UPI0012F082CA|nr:hypothetical protein [Massilia sp. 9I]VXB31505.1 conserved membrane hypothetical protein [Massilia sp. 9I]
MKHLRILALLPALLAALPALAHPGHGAAPGHGLLEHAALPLALLAMIALLAWGTLRRRPGVLPLAIAIVLALGAGSAGVGLPL